MADALELELETPLPIDTIIKGDCIEEMKKLPSNSFDVAIIDPPYNLSSGGNWSWDNSEKLAGFGGNWSKVWKIGIICRLSNISISVQFGLVR